jgi:Uma2 family endonuclease
MIATTTPVPMPVCLSGISWATYESLRTDLEREHRHYRLTFYHGTLELMPPSPEHELYKKTLGRFVETIAEELDLDYQPLGSVTLRYTGHSGAESDECFYFGNAARVRGQQRLEPDNPLPPDLVVEIDITSVSSHRLAVYAELGIPEVWLFDGQDLSLYLLDNGQYLTREQSRLFPTIPIPDIAGFLNRALTSPYPALVREFRAWLQGFCA